MGADVELIRADRIASVFVKRSDQTDRRPLTLSQFGQLQGEVSICAEVLSGRDDMSRVATLLTCHVAQADSASENWLRIRTWAGPT